MSATETTTDTPAPAETPAVTLTLAEQVRKILHDAASPLAFKDISKRIAKFYPKGTKKAPKPAPPSDAEIQAELELPGVSVYPAPKPDGMPKYWHKPPLDVQVLKLFEQSGKKKLADVMTGLDDTPASKLVIAAIKKLVTDGKLFVHGKGKEVEYATFEQPPPLTATEKMEATVHAKVAALGDEVVAEAKLGKPPAKQGAEVAEAFEQLLKQLVAEKKLFAYAGGKYSRKEPKRIEWYETPAHKKSFEALLKATNKVMDSDGVTVDQVFAALRAKLAQSPPAAKPVLKLHEPSVDTHPPEVPPHDLRTVLKQAYDHLCQFVDHRLVELRAVYHQAVKTHPELTAGEFHRTLWEMHTERILELHVLNEVKKALEPNLAIERDHHLYYYMIWK